jgi:hypothetical protein
MRTRLFKKAEMNNVHLKALEDLELYLPRVSLGEAFGGSERNAQATICAKGSLESRMETPRISGNEADFLASRT